MDQQNIEIEDQLKTAVIYGDVNTASTLLKAHEGLRAKQHEKNSLFPMCLRNHAREMVKVFMNEDKSLALKTGYTQAHQYAETDDLPALEILLKAEPALLHAKDSYGNTPLHLAATQGNVKIVEYLYKQGASLTLENADKNSPLQLALLFDKNPGQPMAKYLVNQMATDKQLNTSFMLDQEAKNTKAYYSQIPGLKFIDQQAWNILIDSKYSYSYSYDSENKEDKPKSIGELLIKEGYAPYLENITVNAPYFHYNMMPFDLSEMHFDHCVFKGAFSQTKFYNAQIKNSQFDHVYFNQAEFGYGVQFENTSFTDAYFQNSMFFKNVFKDTVFSYTSFANTTVSEANFDNVFISHSNLLGLHFLYPQNIQVVMDNSVFKPDMVEAWSKKIQFLNTDAPTIGIISSPHEIIYGGEVGMTAADPYSRLKQYGANPVLLDVQGLNQDINIDKLAQEIKAILSAAPAGVNIPKYLLSQKAENLDKVIASANEYAKYLDGAWIPGGPDVHPAFYGQVNKGSYESDYSYIREVFEFALIDHMVTHNKPLMGICHGSQITNVYFGGTLLQDVDGHHDDHLIVPHKQNFAQKGVVSDLLTEPTIGVSNHHQAIDKLGEGLQVVGISGPVLENFIEKPDMPIQTIIEASEGKDNKPVMLFQFHPEYNLDDTNRNILTKFISLAKESKQAHMLEMSDVLSAEHASMPEVVSPAPVYVPVMEPLFLYATEAVVQFV